MSRKILRNAVRFGITPVFLVMAGINYTLEKSGQGHHAPKVDMPDMSAHAGMGHNMGMQAVEAVSASPILGSMWLMYLLMGIAHLGPWLRNKDT